MHLSSITIKGFKSFPERTRLVFSPGVSVIVGPNGCGKSNITDAVLWALGEQSPLAVRGQSMGDMVFAGGEGRGPSRYAEVEVVLTTATRATTRAGGFSEISVRRRHERSGDGGYWMNGARCRLTDIVETPLRCQPRPRDALRDQPGPGGGDRPLEAARPPPAGRGGRRARQAPQAPPPRAAEARAHPGQPRPGPRRRARGAQPAAPAEAPGAGRRHPRPDRARRRRAARAGCSPPSSAGIGAGLEAAEARRREGPGRARRDRVSSSRP